MTDAQKTLRRLLDQQSRDRQRGIELSRVETLDDAQRTEMDELETRSADTERQLRVARSAVEEEEAAAAVDTGTAEGDAEMRERIELRSRCGVGRFLSAALRGRLPDGAERELSEAAGLEAGQIPFELWQRPPADWQVQDRQVQDRAITAAPTSGTGVNLEPLIPEVFAPSIAARMMIDMPMVASGTFSTARVVQGTAPAAAVAKSGTVPEVASTWVVETTTPHRVGAALRLTLEDIATVGQAGFEARLREHISLLVSVEIDDLMVNGDSTVTTTDIDGLFAQLTNAGTPATAVETWIRFLAVQSGVIDGLWATELMHVGMIVGPETYRLAAATFQGNDSEESAASYLKRMGAGDAAFFTNKRMPVKASHIQKGIACLKGRSMMPSPMRTAVCPSWGFFSIDDIVTGAAKGERVFTINTLIGDVILTQPDAYVEVAFRVSV